jgi:hypothetical protein
MSISSFHVLNTTQSTTFEWIKKRVLTALLNQLTPHAQRMLMKLKIMPENNVQRPMVQILSVKTDSTACPIARGSLKFAFLP